MRARNGNGTKRSQSCHRHQCGPFRPVMVLHVLSFTYSAHPTRCPSSSHKLQECPRASHASSKRDWRARIRRSRRCQLYMHV
eukprot:6400799-Amphidinium_carterae.1